MNNCRKGQDVFSRNETQKQKVVRTTNCPFIAAFQSLSPQLVAAAAASVAAAAVAG